MKHVTVETITLRRGIRILLVIECRMRASINEIPERLRNYLNSFKKPQLNLGNYATDPEFLTYGA
jgi:hypothetical protein